MSDNRAYLNLHHAIAAILCSGLSLITAQDNPVQAQTPPPSITPADDGTGSIIQHTDNTYTIEAGSVSSDGLNQFHSFEQFDLAPAETANFVALPGADNIIGRVTGSQASSIHGTLSVTGGTPNLYLINPAGLLFGESARINLPGNFTVTTAGGIGFGLGDRQQWLTPTEPPNYSQLTGHPTAFHFPSAASGSIVNQGHLVLGEQQESLLLAGLVFNTGSIRTPSGNVTLAAAPANTMVRLGQPGQLLSYEVPANSAQRLSQAAADNSSETYAMLSALLTQTNNTTDSATELVTHPDGTVRLQDSNLPLSATAGHAITSGTIDVSNTAAAGGNIHLFGDRVSVLQAALNASGQEQAGQILLGGDQQAQGLYPTASQTLVDSQSTLSANATGNSGDGGRIIVWADQATGFWGSASANAGTSGGNGGFVEVSGKEQLVFQGDVSLDAPSGNSGTLLLDPLDIVIVDGFSAPNDAEIFDFVINSGDGGSSTFTLSEGQIESLSTGFTLRLEATRNITIQNLADNELTFPFGLNSITLRADADNNGTGAVVVQDPNDMLSSAGANINIRGRNLTLGNIDTSTGFGRAGDIRLIASNQISVRDLDTNARMSSPGLGGDVRITAQNQITTRDIITEGDFRGGDVFIRSETITPTTNFISTQSPFGPNGRITLLPPDPNFNIPDGIFDPEFDLGFDDEFEQFDEAVDVALLTNVNDASSSIDIPLDEITSLEQDILGEFSDYFGKSLEEDSLDIEEVQLLLFDVAEQLNNRTAVISAHVVDANVNTGEAGAQKQLELIVLLPDEDPQKFIVPNVDPEALSQTVTAFRSNLLTSVRRGDTSFMSQAKSLHQALVAPLEETLSQANIDTLVYSMAPGLRMVPLAALHDGEQYLIEKYSVGTVPSLSLIDAQFDQPIDAAQVLAMGASSFDTLSPLPGVPIEMDMIRRQWPGASFLNEAFTREALIEQRAQTPYQLIHLATHAEFKAGDINDSYIQLWDDKLRLGELSELGWDSPAVDLLVLSACSTAVGSTEAEMGFAGLAVGAGVRSAMASVWAVSDLGTLALMGEFYSQLNAQPIKAEALRSAQLSMLNEQTKIVDGSLVTPTGETIPLPEDLANGPPPDLSHPYYWSGFTMIGSPW